MGKIKVGSMVYHKTNKKVIMIVVDDSYYRLRCQWISKNGKRKIGKFFKYELILVKKR